MQPFWAMVHLRINPYLAQESDPGTDRSSACLTKIIMRQWMLIMKPLSAASSRSHPKWEFLPSSLIREPRSLKPSVFNEDVVNRYFNGTVSRIGGIGIEDIQKDVEMLHSQAFDPFGSAYG